MRNSLIAIALLGLAAGSAAPAQAGEHRLGFGFHYWKTVDELQDDGFDDIDDSGVSEVFSYQYLPSPVLRWEIDVEYFDKGFGGAIERAYSPQVFLLFGRGIYGGLGVGAIYSSGLADDWSDPFYAARAGLDLLLLPKIHLDINANYQFDAWKQLDDVDTDTLTLGAIARFSF
jgi:hypothetical protein